MAQTVVGVFDSHEGAVHGVEHLRKEGFRADQISIFAPDAREAEGFSDELGVSVIQASATGVVAGGVLGGLSGWLVAATGLLIPGVGPFLIAGPIVGAVLGLVGGASVGGFIGLLVGLGLPHHAAAEYERELKAGRTLVLVHPDGEFARAELALERAHPIGIHRYDELVGGRPEASG